MQIVQMLQREKKFLLARVVDEDALAADSYIKKHFKAGEVYEYVVCFNFDGKEWNGGSYFGYNALQQALDKFYCGSRVTYARLTELATLFKDALIEDDEESAMDYFLGDCDMDNDELDFFEIEHEEEKEFELDYDMSHVDGY